VLVLHFVQMSNTITVRLPEDLAKWLDHTARKTGLPKGRIVREELEKARNSASRPFLRLAGAIAGPSGLSTRKGFSRK
jgi:predicted transcriptional regulator